MIVKSYKILMIPLCLGIIIVILGVYPSITPHIFILGVVGSLSSILSMKFEKFFKPLTLATSALYLVVFLWISMIPGNIIIPVLSYIAVVLIALSILCLLLIRRG